MTPHRPDHRGDPGSGTAWFGGTTWRGNGDADFVCNWRTSESDATDRATVGRFSPPYSAALTFGTKGLLAKCSPTPSENLRRAALIAPSDTFSSGT